MEIIAQERVEQAARVMLRHITGQCFDRANPSLRLAYRRAARAVLDGVLQGLI
jgi:hypothetical protein